MGQRGPKKKPAVTKKRQGTYRPDRDGGLSLPDAIVVPSCPAFLSESARELWTQMGPALVAAKLLSTADTMAFALLCQAWADWQAALAEIAHSGITACSEKGSEYQHPAVGVRNKAWSMVMKGCQEFGLTPSSRSGPVIRSDVDGGEDLDPATKQILGM